MKTAFRFTDDCARCTDISTIILNFRKKCFIIGSDLGNLLRISWSTPLFLKYKYRNLIISKTFSIYKTTTKNFSRWEKEYYDEVLRNFKDFQIFIIS